MGRKKKVPTKKLPGVVEGRKLLKITVWLSPDELERIDSYAKNAGKPRGRWIAEKAS